MINYYVRRELNIAHYAAYATIHLLQMCLFDCFSEMIRERQILAREANTEKINVVLMSSAQEGGHSEHEHTGR